MAVFSSLARLSFTAWIVCSRGILAQGTTNPSIFTKSGRPASHTVLRPVLNQDADTTNLNNLIPSSNVSLHWGQGSSLVHVSLEMASPTVLLEEVDDILSVDCEAISVAVTFNTTEAFDQALANWSEDGNFILVTNHLGDCDTENERGFYNVQTVMSDRSTLKVVASTDKTDVNSTAGM
jgi:hypothetical protein